MPQATPLISTVVVALVLAFIFGAVANRLRLPPLVGYLIAGVLVGPYTPGFTADQELASELSEIGVILLMFGVGLNFSLKDLLSVQAVAIPGALGRIVGATAIGMGMGLLMGWSLGGGLIFGLALSVASTVVLLKALQDRHMLDSERGRIAVGWVIVEDIAMVLALVLIPAFAGIATGAEELARTDPFVSFVERILNADIGVGGVVAVTIVKIAAFVGFMLIVGRRLIPMVLHFTAHTGSRELFRLAVLAIALGVAAGSAYLFGVSLALGAFFAGMILSESELSHRAAQETLPLRDAFGVLFFVAVGMLFDPGIFLRSPLPVVGVLFIVLFAKTALAFFLMIAFKRSIGSALIISVSLAQIGEFSFILAALGVDLGMLTEEGRDLILSGAIVSIILNPLMLWTAERLRPALEARFGAHPDAEAAGARIEPGVVPAPEPPPLPPEEVEEHFTKLTGHTILAGYGRVGTVIGEGLVAADIPFVLIEDAEGRVAAARASGIEVIEGNAATPRALKLANVAGAKTVIIAIPNAFEAGQATEQSRRLNPGLRIVARAHSDEEENHLKHLGADSVVMGEREIGLGMLSLLNDPRTDAVAEALKDADAPIATAIPNPIPAPAHTSSAVEAALTEETFAEEPAPEIAALEALEPQDLLASPEPEPEPWADPMPPHPENLPVEPAAGELLAELEAAEARAGDTPGGPEEDHDELRWHEEELDPWGDDFRPGEPSAAEPLPPEPDDDAVAAEDQDDLKALDGEAAVAEAAPAAAAAAGDDDDPWAAPFPEPPPAEDINVDGALEDAGEIRPTPDQKG